MQQLFEVMPFENELVLVQLPGIYVDSLFQYIAQLQGTPASGFLMSYSKGNTRKDNRYQSLKLNAQPVNSIQDLLNPQYTQPLDTRRDYLIAVNSYMVVGGDGFTMLKHAKKIHYTGINLRTVLAQQLKAEYEANKFIDPRKQIRIYHEPQ
jgi:2',3'-cyclic-nucleotide 2'-phosphodiesterase (5'-nucleotidase family)